MAFFTFNADGSQVHCDILSAGTSSSTSSSTSSTSYNNNNHHASGTASSDHSNRTADSSTNSNIRNVKHNNINRINNKSQGQSIQSRNAVVVVEKGQYHALTAAPASLGYAGFSVVFESSGRVFDPSVSTKVSCMYVIYFYDDYS